MESKNKIRFFNDTIPIVHSSNKTCFCYNLCVFQIVFLWWRCCCCCCFFILPEILIASSVPFQNSMLRTSGPVAVRSTWSLRDSGSILIFFLSFSFSLVRANVYLVFILYHHNTSKTLAEKRARFTWKLQLLPLKHDLNADCFLTSLSTNTTLGTIF